MDAQTFWAALKARGLTFFAGVPDSTFHEAYNVMVDDPEIQYVQAVREDVALGVASAAYFDGKLGGVIMQNSGIGMNDDIEAVFNEFGLGEGVVGGGHAHQNRAPSKSLTQRSVGRGELEYFGGILRNASSRSRSFSVMRS